MLTATQNVPVLPFPHRDNSPFPPAFFEQRLDLKRLLAPENPLEAKLLDLPGFHEGLNWGKPRFGHPEGKVGLHVREVMDNIDLLGTDPVSRQKLRLVALAHDTFKFQEARLFAEGKRLHHGRIAREAVQHLLADEGMLDIIELHDEAFYIWRQHSLQGEQKKALFRLHSLVERMRGNLGLYSAFFKCDTETGDKVIAPLCWFEATLRGASGAATDGI